MKVLHVVGARPNFPKVAALMAAIARHPSAGPQVLVHTGQHYDHNMSKAFFEDLDIPEPDEFLNVGSGTHAEQTAEVMTRIEPVLLKHRPDWVVVVGDVNSTLAAALVSSKLRFAVAHVEAGLRSRDRSMPEEINRLLTDQISDLLFTPSADADENLRREGVDESRIRFVGNVMIDTLVRILPTAIARRTAERLGLTAKRYLLVTMHRPSTVDDPKALQAVLGALEDLASYGPILFPVHPRTRGRIEEFGLPVPDAVQMIDPLGYTEFLAIMHDSALVITDSGGIQEETTYLGVPCLTVRSTTERPITIFHGTNRLVACDRARIAEAAGHALAQPAATPPRLPLWDGHAAERIADHLLDG